MMPNSRFQFLGDGDGDLLAKADTLKVTLMRDKGKVTALFEITGELSSVDDDDGPFSSVNDLAFVRGLIERFEKVKD